MKNRASGFTLIEMLVVVAIIGILAAVAYPSYTQHLVKGRRANAQAYLLDITQKQQQMLLDSRTYAAAADMDDIASDIGVKKVEDVANYYYVAVTVDNDARPPTFLVTATPYHQSQTSDGAMTVDHTGEKLRKVGSNWEPW